MGTSVVSDIYKRFHSEVYQDNSEISWSICGDRLLEEEIKEDVVYERPKFNFPRDGHQSSTFGLQEQCTQVLKKAGFVVEARQFGNAFELLLDNLTYKEIVELLYRFVDFSVESLPAAQRKMIEVLLETKNEASSGSDDADFDGDDVKVSFSIKNKVKQSLKFFTGQSSFKEQLECLRSGAQERNNFGKNYLFHMSNPMAQELVANLLIDFWNNEQVEGEKSGAQKIDKAQVGNNWLSVKEFENLYPMGFLELDNLHTTPMMLASYGFATQIGIAFFDKIQKNKAGFDGETVSRLGWDHKDLTGISGRALWTIGAASLFRKAFHFGNGKGDDDKIKSGFEEKDCPWVNVVRDRFSSFKDLSSEQVIWGIYSFLDPEGANMVRNAVLEQIKAKDGQWFEASKFKVEYEKYEIALNCSNIFECLISGKEKGPQLPERHKAILRL